MDSKRIAELFRSGIDCSQVVLAHFAGETGISADEADRLAACFGGGMGRGETCGAIVGAMIAIGAKYGHARGSIERKELMSRKRAELFDAIKEDYPSTLCRDILGHDISDPEELKTVLDSGMLFTLCPEVCRRVIDALEEIL